MTDPYATPEWYDPSSLVRRLGGIYAIPINDGLGPLEGEVILDGQPHHVRKFENQPEIQIRAAGMIENLEAGHAFNPDEIHALIEELKIPADPIGIGRVYIVPIHLEAIARLKEFLPS
jgi:hypothetical protein